ncbi:MAG: hypothetical protein HC887_06820 [Desulfobacteraceae bacterium]|nr:hypothetical protein [Desulfobacteraceae bacterium]
MKIRKIYPYDVGPVCREINFKDEWNGTIHRQILFSGPNGSGKTVILKAVATLWNAAGHWLDHRKLLPQTDKNLIWLKHWVEKGIGIIFEEAGFTSLPIGIFLGHIHILQIFAVRQTYGSAKFSNRKISANLSEIIMRKS